MNLITWDTFKAMKGSSIDLTIAGTPLTGIGGAPISPMGTINLEVELGNPDTGTTSVCTVPFRNAVSLQRVTGEALVV